MNSNAAAHCVAHTGHERWPMVENIRPPHVGISIARTLAEIEAIGRLRYAFFIERDRKPYLHADHRARIFLEPIDRLSLNFQACAARRCAASLRLSWANDCKADIQLRQTIERSRLAEFELLNTLVASRFVIGDAANARLMIIHLFRHVYEIGLTSGARFCLMSTRPALAGLFERLGFFSEERPYADPVAGELQAFKLDLLDRRELRLVNSPFLAVLDHYTLSPPPLSRMMQA